MINENIINPIIAVIQGLFSFAFNTPLVSWGGYSLSIGACMVSFAVIALLARVIIPSGDSTEKGGK